MARITDLLAEFAATVRVWRDASFRVCYTHKERSLPEMAKRYGVRYTVTEIAACREL